MKGLAFAVSLFHRLSAEHPQFKAIEILDKVDDVVMRLGAAGRIAEAAFEDAVTGVPVDASAVPPAAPATPSKIPASEIGPAGVSPSDPVRAIVGGASTPPPAPTPPAPGIAGIPAGK